MLRGIRGHARRPSCVLRSPLGCEVLVAIVDRLELAPVDRNDSPREKVELIGLDTVVWRCAGAIAAINGAVGHPGGAFDRILKTIEKVAAKKPVAGTQDADPAEAEQAQPPKRKPRKKTGAKRITVGRKPFKRAPKRGE
jgi:hypothetical protein